MKKLLCIICTVVTTFLCAAFCGCGEKFKPSAEHYFEINNGYRVIELASETPERIGDYGLNSFIYPTSGSLVEVKVTFDTEFVKGSMFFEDAGALNREGVFAVYDCLNVSPVLVGEEIYSCVGTGLFTFNKKAEYATKVQATVTLDPDESRNLVGHIADVDVYTFNYKDLTKSGEEKGEGTFKVLIVAGNSYIGRFSMKV